MSAVVEERAPAVAPMPAAPEPAPPPRPDLRRRTAALILLGTLAAAGALRLIGLGALGLNSDEAVYAGQSAALAGNPYYEAFPVFRAHPMLVQSLLSLVYGRGEHDVAGRVVVALIGVATIVPVYLLGVELYDRRVGLTAALLIAVMPYHVVVTRQVLLDGPMVFFAAVTLLCVAKFARTQRLLWFVAAGGALGLSMLAKETSIVLTSAVYAFLALTPSVRRPLLGSAAALAVTAAVFLVHPVSMALAGNTSTGKSYLVWQLLRRPNHEWTFYPTTVPWAIGPLVLLVAVGGLWWARDRTGWREVLLICWTLAPVLAFQLWPVKGFQYLLPVVPAVAVLAARGAWTFGAPASTVRAPALRSARAGRVRWPIRATTGSPERRLTAGRRRWGAAQALPAAVCALVVLSLLPVTVQRAFRTNATEVLAGTGGVPGGREAGRWMRTHTPSGATVLTLGPSMANIIQYYGHRPSYGLSVSPNPLHRNPSYSPVLNPDRQMRMGDLQYVVWDAFSAVRSPHFSETLLMLTRRYHGRALHTEYVTRTGAGGRDERVPVVVVYQVRP